MPALCYNTEKQRRCGPCLGRNAAAGPAPLVNIVGKSRSGCVDTLFC